MLVPANFQNKEITEVQEFLRHNAFANLVSTVQGKLWATHIPLMLSEDGKKLHGHISRSNPQWKYFDELKDVMAIFNGPHAYISSSWYNHENVPTWNYIAVHVYGTVRVIEGDELFDALKSLTDKYESKSVNPVSIEKMSKEYVEKSIRGLVGFELTINEIQAAYKLSQNRDEENYRHIIAELEQRNEGDDFKIASEMKMKLNTLYKQK
jgi:transcriptional regulator